jgi:hypothetical protein
MLGQNILFKREVHVKCSSVLGGEHLSDVIFDEFNNTLLDSLAQRDGKHKV